MSRSTIREYGTVAFESEIMREMIRIGTPIFDEEGTLLFWDKASGELCLGFWMEMVPEIYRESITSIVETIFPSYQYEPLTPITIERFIIDIQQHFREWFVTAR